VNYLLNILRFKLVVDQENSSVSVSLVKYLSIFEKYIAIDLSTVTREKNSFYSEIEPESFT